MQLFLPPSFSQSDNSPSPLRIPPPPFAAAHIRRSENDEIAFDDIPPYLSAVALYGGDQEAEDQCRFSADDFVRAVRFHAHGTRHHQRVVGGGVVHCGSAGAVAARFLPPLGGIADPSPVGAPTERSVLRSGFEVHKSPLHLPRSLAAAGLVVQSLLSDHIPRRILSLLRELRAAIEGFHGRPHRAL